MPPGAMEEIRAADPMIDAGLLVVEVAARMSQLTIDFKLEPTARRGHARHVAISMVGPIVSNARAGRKVVLRMGTTTTQIAEHVWWHGQIVRPIIAR